MKTNMKKIAAWMLALLLVLQMVTAIADNSVEGATTVTSQVLKSDSKLLEQLEITSPSTSIPAETPIPLTFTSGYDHLEWSSSNEEIATVEAGVVTGHKEGTVKIKAQQKMNDNNIISDTIVLKVVAPVATSEEVSDTPEETGGEEGKPQESQKTVIIINGNKDKLDYTGESQKYSGYTVVPESETENVVLLNESKIFSEKDCLTYRSEFTAEDFQYNGDAANVEFVINNGWMQIKPATVTVKADSKEKVAGEPDPEMTATVEGLFNENDQIIYELSRMEGEEAGVWPIFAEGEELQGNYRVKYETGNLTIVAQGLSGTYLLGNLQTGGLLTTTPMPISDKRLTAVSYVEAENGLVQTNGQKDYWTFQMQTNGKYYITSGGQYLNLGDKKELYMSSDPQELTVNVLPEGKIEILNKNGLRVNVKGQNMTNGFQCYKSNKAVEENEKLTLYRGVIEPQEGKTVVGFNVNGGNSKAPKAMLVNDGSYITLPNLSGTQNGNAFLGWAEVKDIKTAVPGTNHTYHDVYPAGSRYWVSGSEVTLYATWNNTDKKVQFGIRKDGQIQEEPNGYPVDKYVGHFTVEDAVKNGYWIIDNVTNSAINDYYVVNKITANLKHIPTADEIKTALKNDGNMDFDPETQYVHWYVLKWAKNGWHVDGVIRNKETKSIGYHSCVTESERLSVNDMPAGYSVLPGTEIKIGSNAEGKVKEPSREGYTFLGWNTKDNGRGKSYKTNETITLNEDIDLYAQWEKYVERGVKVDSSLAGVDKVYAGTEVTLTATPIGFDGIEYDVRWESEKNGERTVIPGETELTYTFKLDTENSQYTYHAILTPKE